MPLKGRLTVFYLEVGNKNDDPERKVVETEDAYKFAGQMGIQLFETSAKENVNVEEVRPGQSPVGSSGPHASQLLLALLHHHSPHSTPSLPRA